MDMVLRHARSGDTKTVGIGWSWNLFLSSAFLGLPLFFRGLALWGTGMVVAWTVRFAMPAAAGADGELLEWMLSIGVLGLCGFFGLKGNALTAKRLFALSYDFANPDTAEARLAAQIWGL